MRLLVALLTASLAVAAQEPPRLIIDQSLDQTKIDLARWQREVYPRLLRLAGQDKLPDTITITYVQGNTSYGGPYLNGTVYFGAYPLNPNDISDGQYVALTHEFSHALTPFGVAFSPAMDEGMANTMSCFVYQELHEQDPAIRPCFYGSFSDAINNQDANAGAGGNDFYSQPTYPYDSASGPLQILLQTEEDFRAVTRAAEAAHLLDYQTTCFDYAAFIDQALGFRGIAGTSITTFLHRTIAANVKTNANVLDGKAFAVIAIGGPDGFVSSQTKSTINPFAIDFRYTERTGSAFKRLSGTVTWWISDSKGQVVTPKTTTQIGDPLAGGSQSTFLPDYCGEQGAGVGLCSLPNGGYKLTACVDDLCDSTFFGRYHSSRDPSWMYHSLFVITNGPNFTDLSDSSPVVPKDSNVEILPGMIRFRSVTADAALKAWGHDLQFAYHPVFSPVYFLTQRDSPVLLSVNDSATFKTVAEVSPGSLLTLFTWGATHHDPQTSFTTPLPTESCTGPRGVTRVLFTDESGNATPAAVQYCSFNQINVQVPTGLTPGSSIRIEVDLNGTKSNPKTVTVVPATPTIFVMDGKRLGAVIFAIGPKAGQLVTADSPAAPGDVLSVYCTGLGVTNPPARSGEAATANPLLWTLLPVQVLTENGSWPVYFSGLAPGFVGLYQINTLVPANTPQGNYNLKISVGDRDSNKVAIPVRPVQGKAQVFMGGLGLFSFLFYGISMTAGGLWVVPKGMRGVVPLLNILGPTTGTW